MYIEEKDVLDKFKISPSLTNYVDMSFDDLELHVSDGCLSVVTKKHVPRHNAGEEYLFGFALGFMMLAGLASVVF